jgi:GGDEF domain-containing protein
MAEATPPTADDRMKRLESQLTSQREEINRLRRTIDNFIPVDVDTGLLNRNGLIDSIKRAALWWERRREPFGVLVVQIPGLAEAPVEQKHELAIAVADTMLSTLRAVDDTGRIEETTYAAVMREFEQAGGAIVAARLRTALRAALGAVPGAGDEVRIAMSVVVEGQVREPSHYLDVAIEAANQALSDLPRVVES